MQNLFFPLTAINVRQVRSLSQELERQTNKNFFYSMLRGLDVVFLMQIEDWLF